MAKAKTSKQKTFPSFPQVWPGLSRSPTMLQAPLQLALTPTPSSAQTHLHSTGSYGRPIHHYTLHPSILYHCSSAGKESVCNAGGPGSIPGSGSSPEEGISYSLRYSCLENSTDKEPGGLRFIHGVSKSWTRLSD